MGLTWFQVAVVLGALWVAALIFQGFGTIFSYVYLKLGARARVPEISERSWAPVSILKPLKGLDDGLEVCLESFFKLEYPVFELIFSVADPRDPAASVVKRLQERYPNVDSCLVGGDVPIGANPKINNLAWPLGIAKYETTLVSDACVEVPKDYLRELMPRLHGPVVCVSAILRGHAGEGFAGKLEELHLNTYYARTVLTLRGIGLAFVFGPCMLFPRAAAEPFGGLVNLCNYIAEDYELGKRFRGEGGKIRLSGRPLAYRIGRKDFKSFWFRHQRWHVIQKFNERLPFFLEPFGFSLSHSLVAALAADGLGGTWWVAFLGSFVLALAQDLIVMRAMRQPFYPLVWLAREFCAPLIWTHAAVSSHVNWRGTQLHVLERGLVERDTETKDSQLPRAG